MTVSKDDILAKFLDGLYRDVLAMEEESGLVAGGGDLRPPIEAYHDAIRAWMSGNSPERLSVAWVSHDMASMRKRIGWLRSGPTIFWQDKDPRYRETLEAAEKFKQALIRDAKKITLPPQMLVDDLVAFGRRIKGMDEQEVEGELRARKAQRFLPSRTGGGGQWRSLGAEEFLSGFAYTAGFFNQLQKELAAAPQQGQLEDKTGNKARLQRLSSRDIAKTGEEALKNLWIQVMHPLSLRAAFKQKNPNAIPRFDEKRYVSEEEWRRMEMQAHRMAEAYGRYAVMFAAALAGVVDQNYKELLGTLDGVVADAYRLLGMVEDMQKGGGKLEIHQLERLVKEVENEELRKRLQEMLDAMRVNRAGSSGAGGVINNVITQADREIDQLEQAHFTFLSSQLAVYETSRDVVKSLAMQGLNLAGKFVEAAAQVAAGRGRGGGRGV